MQEYIGPRSIVALLKACASQKDLHRGSSIHGYMTRMGLLDKDITAGNTLVSMYAKCGSLTKAQEVFDRLPIRNIVSWNALITGYVQNGNGEEALNVFDKMQVLGISPNSVTFLCILKACSSTGATMKGKQIHAQIAREGLLENNIVVGTALVDMYSKYGLLATAQEVFDKLTGRDVVLWTALTAGYSQHGHAEEALSCFDRMQVEGICPNVITFVCILKSCGDVGDSHKGQEIHSQILELLEKNVVVGNALVDMYAKCGLLNKAREVFDELPIRDEALWNTLIGRYVEHGYPVEALNCFEKMKLKGFSPTAVTFICILKACISIEAIDKGQNIYVEIVRKRLLEKDVTVGNALLDAFARGGLLEKTREVFDNLLVRDVVSWNALIAGYAQHGHGEKALNCFQRMQLEGISPNAGTYIAILKACGSIQATDKGEEIHAEIHRRGLLDKDVFIGTALVNMYIKCRVLAKAREVFDKLPLQNVVTWNALIAGYAQCGYSEEALSFFELMQLEGTSPNAVTFICVLKACGITRAVDKGHLIHAQVVREGLLDKDTVLGTALIDMYAKCGLFAKAHEVFNKLQVHNVVLWSALIGGYAQHGHAEEALNCFARMQLEGLSPNNVTFVCALKACGIIGAVDKGEEIHADISRKKLLERDIAVGNALVDMYAKVGLLAKAEVVLNNILVRNVVTWNALIAGYALMGQAEGVFCVLDRMIADNIKPDLVTFTCVLNACGHTGLLDKGLLYFNTMNIGYGIIPALEHYSCMVDLLARAGHIEEAVAMIEEMPFFANLAMWHAVLSACRKWGNAEYARLAFEHAVQLDDKYAATYICMSNIYLGAGKQEDANRIEAMRIERKAWKFVMD